MDIAELKELESKATPGRWGITDAHPETGTAICAVNPDGKCQKCLSNFNSDRDAQLTSALRNLAPELIALWEVCKDFKKCPPGYGAFWEVGKALDALDDKARSMVI